MPRLILFVLRQQMKLEDLNLMFIMTSGLLYETFTSIRWAVLNYRIPYFTNDMSGKG